MKILIAIPVYDGKLPVETARCLLDEQIFGLASGDQIAVRFLPSCSHAAMGRNQLAQDFVDSDSDRIVFLDSDITFEMGSIVKLANRTEELVGGAYRFKMEPESYPVGWAPDPEAKGLQASPSGLLEVASLPGGFLALSRSVFEKLRSAHPERKFEHFGRVMHAYFEMRFEGGQLYGEDAFFCKSWREIGGTVWLDPEIALTHWDFNRPFSGHVGNWLKSRSRRCEEP